MQLCVIYETSLVLMSDTVVKPAGCLETRVNHKHAGSGGILVLKKYQTVLFRFFLTSFIFAGVIFTVSGQQQSKNSDLFDLKDFGEFRLPNSLRPLFEPQIERGPINHVDVGKFEGLEPIFSASSSKGGTLPGSTPDFGDVDIRIDPCDGLLCQDLTSPVTLESAAIKRSFEELKVAVIKKAKDDGDSVVEWLGPELKPIGGGTAICVTVRTRFRDGGLDVSMNCYIFNHDLRYTIQTRFHERDREFWEPQMAQFLESIKIKDRAPTK